MYVGGGVLLVIVLVIVAVLLLRRLGRRPPVRSNWEAARKRIGARVLRSLLRQHVVGVEQVQHLPDAHLGDAPVEVAVQDAEHANAHHVPRGGGFRTLTKFGAHDCPPVSMRIRLTSSRP